MTMVRYARSAHRSHRLSLRSDEATCDAPFRRLARAIMREGEASVTYMLLQGYLLYSFDQGLGGGGGPQRWIRKPLRLPNRVTIRIIVSQWQRPGTLQ